jgi:type VI secretion system protein ImpJ
VPEDGPLPALDFKAALSRTAALTVYLAVPRATLGRANVSEGDDDGRRWRVDTLELEDENTGVNPQPVAVRLPNLKLLTSDEDRGGYDALPLARLERSPGAEATPQLAAAYFPPLLACDAWPALQNDILQTVADRIGKKLDLLAGQVVSRGVGFDSRGQGDPLLLAQLRVLNEAAAALSVVAFVPGIHPREAFLELCRLVGQLAVFGPTRKLPDLPRYDHDDLGTCFWRLKQYIDGLLDVVVEPEYKERPFIGAGMRMQVSLEPAWLEAAWQMYIGVQSPLDGEELVRLLTRPGQLDMKVGSSERVDAIFRLGQASLKFTHAPLPPRALPGESGLIYFQVDRETAQTEWGNVQRSLTLAVRMNETLIAGDIQGQRVLTIRRGGQTFPMQFTLYIVPRHLVSGGPDEG